MTLIILAFALWFFLQALEALLAALLVPAPRSRVAVFAYCMAAGLVLLFCAGYFPEHLTRL